MFVTGVGRRSMSSVWSEFALSLILKWTGRLSVVCYVWNGWEGSQLCLYLGWVDGLLVVFISGVGRWAIKS